MSARSRMTMRATFERNNGAKNTYGGKDINWMLLGDPIPCYAWAGSGAKQTNFGDGATVTIDMPGMIVPLSTDVTPKDRVLNVRDRRSRTIFSEVMYIDHVSRRSTHLELRLRDYA